MVDALLYNILLSILTEIDWRKNHCNVRWFDLAIWSFGHFVAIKMLMFASGAYILWPMWRPEPYKGEIWVEKKYVCFYRMARVYQEEFAASKTCYFPVKAWR